MIIREDKSYELNSRYPSTNWYEGESNFIIDETTKEGIELKNKYMENYPFVDIKYSDDNIVTDVILLDKPPMLGEIEGKTIVLDLNEDGEWEYVYVEKPISESEKELEVLKQQNLELSGTLDMILTDILPNII